MKKIIMLLILLAIVKFSGAQNVGIGTTEPIHAKLQINGTVGAAVAMFGADKFGVTIEANNPEIGFNYFYNNGPKTIKAGYASQIGMSPGNGDLYISNFNGNQSLVDFGDIAGYRQNFTLKQSGEIDLLGADYYSHFFFGNNQDTYLRGGKNGSNVLINDVNNGRVGIGMGIPRVALEQNGVVGNTAAIFGGEGTGVSFQRDWPAIGLNHWYDGATERAIGIGYGAQIAVNQTIGASGGAITFTNFSPRVNAINGPLLNKITNVFIQSGRIGVGTNVPESDINILHTNPGFGSTNLNYGLRIECPQGFSSYFNIFSYGGGSLAFANNGDFRASISASSGAYYSVSDKNLKKNIHYLGDEKIIDKILLLKPAEYNMLPDENNAPKNYGFIAQDVEQQFPDFILDLGDKKALCYQYFIPLLTRGMQEQQLQIDSLQIENENLKARITRLEKLLLKQ